MWRFEGTAATVLIGVLLVTLGGCEREERPAAPAKTTQTTAATSKPTDAELANIRQTMQEQTPRGNEALPPGHPPLDAGAPQMPPMEGVPPVQGGLKYTAPATWEKEAVKSAMRVDQFKLPRAEGDSEDGELAVFGTNIGGGIEPNIERWRGQFTGADGQPVPESAMTRQTFDANGLKVTFVDVTGRYNAGAMMGAPAAGPKDNFRLFGAIVETPAGPWYFKATGPAATMEKHREEFMQFLHSMGAK